MIHIRAGYLVIAQHSVNADRGQRTESPAHTRERWALSVPTAPKAPPKGCHITFVQTVQVRPLSRACGGGLMSALHEQLASDGLLQIGATTAHAQLDSLAQQAAAHHWSYSHFLGRLLEAEIAARRQRVIEISLHFSGLPWQKRLSDFDFSFQLSIDRALIEELATGRFMDEGRNVIFQGPPGVGKPTWRSPWAWPAPKAANACSSWAPWSWPGA